MEEKLKANLQQSHEFHTCSPTTPPPPAVEVEDNKINDDVLKTPTSAVSKIRPIFTCPSAPRKPKATPLRKRKGSHRLLDLSNDVLSLYPPALIADFGNKLKKARRHNQQLIGEQQKENKCSNVN